MPYYYCCMKSPCHLTYNINSIQRRNIIERAYANSQQHAYSMPKAAYIYSDAPSEQIPQLYDLYSQNKAKDLGSVKIVPVRQLVRLQLRQILPTPNGKVLEKPEDSSCEALNCGKITRTISRNFPRYGNQRTGLLLCCENEEELDKYETRQIVGCRQKGDGIYRMKVTTKAKG